jgi:hypothetical protein
MPDWHNVEWIKMFHHCPNGRNYMVLHHHKGPIYRTSKTIDQWSGMGWLLKVLSLAIWRISAWVGKRVCGMDARYFDDMEWTPLPCLATD